MNSIAEKIKEICNTIEDCNNKIEELKSSISTYNKQIKRLTKIQEELDVLGLNE